MDILKKYDVDSLDNRDPRAIELVSRFMTRLAKDYHKMELRGTERVVPGAGLYVANHNSGGHAPDPFYLSTELYRIYGFDEVPYGLMHGFAINLPFFHQAYIPLGAIRASHENAHRAFERGNKVLVYPGSDYDAFRPYRHRDRIVFEGRTGYIRLALQENIPIYPLVTAGAHTQFIIIDDMRWLAKYSPKSFRSKAMPLALSIPWGLTLLPAMPPTFALPMRILMEILEPVRFERYGADAAGDESYVRQCADRVETAMQETLTRLARERAAAKK